MQRGNFVGKVLPGHARRHSAVSCAKMLKQSRCCLGYGRRWAEKTLQVLCFVLMFSSSFIISYAFHVACALISYPAGPGSFGAERLSTPAAITCSVSSNSS